jgi:hypothetical protein
VVVAKAKVKPDKANTGGGYRYRVVGAGSAGRIVVESNELTFLAGLRSEIAKNFTRIGFQRHSGDRWFPWTNGQAGTRSSSMSTSSGQRPLSGSGR